jgi:hypothetical protein
MGGRGSGRTPPAYLEDGRVVTLRNALATGNTRTAAAAYAGIHRDTLYAWLARRPMFAQAARPGGEAGSGPTAVLGLSRTKPSSCGCVLRFLHCTPEESAAPNRSEEADRSALL